ncbi:MAG: glycosyltransferase family 4 protein [Candidatus Hodarchaeota archaeon]
MENLEKNKTLPKILHFIWWIPHYRSSIFRKLCQNPNFDFEVIAGNNSKTWGGGMVTSAEEAGKINGIKWRCVKSKRIIGPIFKDYEWQPESIKIILREKPDAVICLGNKSLSNFIIRFICRVRKTPLIEWSHGVLAPEAMWKWLLRKFLYVRWTDANLLYGSFARDWYMSHGINEKSLFVVNNSLDYNQQLLIRNEVDQKEIIKIRSKYGINHPEGRLLIHAGRMEKQKRLSFLIDVLTIIKKQERKIKLILIGSGRDEQKLQKKAKKRGLENTVIFFGPCFEEKTLGRLFMASDLCVVPGGVGLIAMHSLVYGTPILTCDNATFIHKPEVEAIKDGITGAYYRESDLNDCIQKIIDLLYPISCKERMSKACMDIIDRFYTPQYQEKIIIKALNYVLPAQKQIPYEP